MGNLNRKFVGQDYTIPQDGPKQRRTLLASPPDAQTLPVQVGTLAGKPKWFADFSRPYFIPDGRPAASFAASANGGGENKPATYLNGRKIKDRIDLDLTTARTDFAINVGGSVVVYADSTAGTDRVSVRFATSDGDQAGVLVPFRPGQFIGGERYSRILLSNAAQAGSTATLLLVEDKPGDEFSYR